MNAAVVTIGSVLTVLIVLGMWIAIVDGIREALIIIGSIIGVFIGCLAVVLFWMWAAGAFA